jgi:hypothetical protein
MIVDIPAEIQAAHLRIRPRCVSTLLQKGFSCRLTYQNEVHFYLSVGGVRSERTGSFIVCFAVQMRSAIQVLYVTFVSFCSKFLPWTAASSLEVWYWNFSPFLIACHSAGTQQIWRLSARPKSCSRYQSIITVITIILIIIYVTRTNKMHTFFFIND